jgi:hypothetical protein
MKKSKLAAAFWAAAPQDEKKRCHSERSEESLFDLTIREKNKERFFASLRMTEQGIRITAPSTALIKSA